MIPLSKPYIDEKDIAGVVEVLKSGWLSLGPKLKEFEEKFAKFVGVKHAIAVSSGTAGLHLCMKALGVGFGDEVITTPFSFVASSNCVVYEDANPVFVDIDEKTFNIDVSKIEEKITDKTKAILPVHIFGQSADMNAIMKIAEKRGLYVVEDAAEAIGAEYFGKKVGTFGNASVFAFYPNKQMTTGEGGMICTDDDKFAELCRSLRNQGRADNDEWLSHEKIGFNYRLDEMSCALGVTQLDKIDFLLSDRKRVANTYDVELEDVEGVSLPNRDSNKRSWFVYVVRLSAGVDRDKVISLLKDHGVQSKPYLPAIHLQKPYLELGYSEGDFPVCEAVSRSTIALPFYTGMAADQVKVVCDALKGVLRNV
jgi:perosamine synthetase